MRGHTWSAKKIWVVKVWKSSQRPHIPCFRRPSHIFSHTYSINYRAYIIHIIWFASALMICKKFITETTFLWPDFIQPGFHTNESNFSLEMDYWCTKISYSNLCFFQTGRSGFCSRFLQCHEWIPNQFEVIWLSGGTMKGPNLNSGFYSSSCSIYIYTPALSPPPHPPLLLPLMILLLFKKLPNKGYQKFMTHKMIASEYINNGCKFCLHSFRHWKVPTQLPYFLT